MVSHEVSRHRCGHQHRDGSSGVFRVALDTLRSTGGQYRAIQARRLRAGVAGICAALITASPLHALSCIPYGIPDALDEVINAQEGYVAVTGTLRLKEDDLPWPDPDTMIAPDLTKVKARINGKALSRAGFKNKFKTDLTLEVACLGQWCARAKDKSRVLVFHKQTQQGYTLGLNPCGDHLFFEPTKADLRQVEQCYLKGDCPKPELR